MKASKSSISRESSKTWRVPHNLAPQPAAEMPKSFFLSKDCRNQLAPFDVLVEPLTGSHPYLYKEAICVSW